MAEKQKTMISIRNVSKQYTLGTIGGTTLRDEIQRKIAKLRKQDDPIAKIGQKSGKIGEKFLALNDISFDVRKGEALGIIGHNGAGKSTLLKLLSRVTAPTKGTIGLNGRVASMLEVGTGFHPELTGRENIYMNGAILGMTKKEIDSKIDDIIEFSECRQFIDTPVKRYSSGMYVKLAFSVAAHLDSEIIIMDEVLAVGDMAFQKKCLSKMREAARTDGRTVLYVSHNMSTIRQLCDRCIVLDKGKVIFDGNVEDSIATYLGTISNFENTYNYTKEHHRNKNSTDNFIIQKLHIQGNEGNRFYLCDKISMYLYADLKKDYDDVRVRFVLSYSDGSIVGTMLSSNTINMKKGLNQQIALTMDTEHLMYGSYRVDVILFRSSELGGEYVIDGVYPGFFIEIIEKIDDSHKVLWLHQYWGHIKLNDIKIE